MTTPNTTNTNNIDRREFLGLGAMGLAGVMAGALSPAKAAAQNARQDSQPAAPARENAGTKSRPNIILFMPDELRADALACFGNPLTKTPNFDLLARQGARFQNCHVQYPVCGGSRCSLLTGWPACVRGHRSLAYFLRPDEPNLFRYLKQSGYDVFWFGKNDALAAQSFHDSVTAWNHVDGKPVTGRAWTGAGGGGKAGGGRPGGKSSAAPAAKRPHDYPRTFIPDNFPERTATDDYQHVAAAIKILEHKQQDRPFCIFLPLTAPHPPYEPPQGFRGLHKPADITNLRPIGLPKKPDYIDAIRKEYRLDRVPPETFREVRALYYDFVSYSDWLLGQVMEAMERTNHASDTALFVFSDHGDYAGDYGLTEKWTSGLEDPLTHVPVLARVPGGKPGSVCREMTELYDVMATCLELAGVTARHTHFARSLMPQIHGAPGDPLRCAFSEGGYNEYEPQCFEGENNNDQAALYYPKQHLQNIQPRAISRSAMIRTPEYKLISRPQGQSELYIYADDPQELNNRYGETSVAPIQTRLQERLLHWYQNVAGVAPMDKDPRGFPRYTPPPAPPAPAAPPKPAPGSLPAFAKAPGFTIPGAVKRIFDKESP